MPGGCLCCTIRGDIESTVHALLRRRAAGDIPQFSRLLIETSGLADPIPLLHTLRNSPLLREAGCSHPHVIAVLDGQLALDTLRRFPEAGAQIVAADVIVLSKVDLTPTVEREHLSAAARAINPWADIYTADLLNTDPSRYFNGEYAHGGQGDGDRKRWLGKMTVATRHAGIATDCLTLVQPLDWMAFGLWMTALLHRHGRSVLRVKGILDIAGLAGPVLFHSAQHLIHPPIHLDEWRFDRSGSRLVFIVRDIDTAVLRDSLLAFELAARNSAKVPESTQYMNGGGGGSIAGRPIRRPSAPRWIKG
jgi:G3E family GTPase